jgi:N-methylhydantoinase B
VSGTFGLGTRFGTGKISNLVLEPGWALRIMLGGGGGWGDPLERPVDLVETDVREGLHTTDFARRGYGVELDECGGVNLDATQALRTSLAKARAAGKWSVPLAAPSEWRV